MLDFRIKTFLTVCKYMNFTKAASELHITQPAVSNHIQFLESYYNTELFNRSGKHMTLTESGIILRSSLETMRNSEQKLYELFKMQKLQKKVLTFGVTMTVGEYIIAPSLKKYIDLNPDVDIHIRYANTSILLNELKDGKIEFAIIEGFYDQSQYENIKFKTEPFICVCNSNHNFKNPVTSLKDLFSQRLIIREPKSGTRSILEKILSINDIKVNNFQHFVEVENMHMIVNLIKEDCGISFLYKSAVQNELNSGELKEINIPGFPFYHELTFIWNKNSPFSNEYIEIYNTFIQV